VALVAVALALTIANGWPRGEMPIDGNNLRGPALAICGFPQPAVLLILQREGLQGGDEMTVWRSLRRPKDPQNREPEFGYAGNFHIRPTDKSAPVTFEDGSTTRVYDAGALWLDVGVGVAAVIAAYALCAWLAWRAARRR
jgi:hypothetical protein